MSATLSSTSETGMKTSMPMSVVIRIQQSRTSSSGPAKLPRSSPTLRAVPVITSPDPFKVQATRRLRRTAVTTSASCSTSRMVSTRLLSLTIPYLPHTYWPHRYGLYPQTARRRRFGLGQAAGIVAVHGIQKKIRAEQVTVFREHLGESIRHRFDHHLAGGRHVAFALLGEDFGDFRVVLCGEHLSLPAKLPVHDRNDCSNRNDQDHGCEWMHGQPTPKIGEKSNHRPGLPVTGLTDSRTSSRSRRSRVLRDRREACCASRLLIRCCCCLMNADLPRTCWRRARGLCATSHQGWKRWSAQRRERAGTTCKMIRCDEEA